MARRCVQADDVNAQIQHGNDGCEITIGLSVIQKTLSHSQPKMTKRWRAAKLLILFQTSDVRIKNVRVREREMNCEWPECWRVGGKKGIVRKKRRGRGL